MSRLADVEQTLDLPPGYTLVALRELGDAFAHGCDIAAEAGAGTLVWVRRYDLVEFAVVLEPDEPLLSARRALFAGMNAVVDAIAAHCPPEREVSFGWPDAIRFDGGLLGGARLGWPADCAEAEVPAWLVFGVMTTSSGVSPGVSAAEVWTSLITLTLLYAALGVIEIRLLLRTIATGAPKFEEPVDPADRDENAPLVFAY